MSAAFFEQVWPRGNRWPRALRDGWKLTLAGKRRKRCKDLRGGIEGRDGFLPIRIYIFSGLASAQSGTSFLYTCARKNYRNSRVTARLALCHRYYSHIQILAKLSLNSHNPRRRHNLSEVLDVGERDAAAV
jgi:hypothetical protein